MQAVSTEVGPQLQERQGEPNHGRRREDQVQEGEEEGQQDQVIRHSERAEAMSPVEQTVKHGARKQILGHVKRKIQEREQNHEAFVSEAMLPEILSLQTIAEVFSGFEF